jgi:environmental stress-induced protein Ves
VDISGVELLPAGSHRSVPWRNGRGVTAEIVVEPDGDDWHWRLSLAEVPSSDDFSLFPGVERTIVVVAGAGMALSIDGAPERVVRPLQPLVFSGDVSTSCRLLAGPVRDLNLMVRRDAALGRLDIVALAPGEVLERTDWSVVVVLTGSAECGNDRLERLDAVRVPADAVRPVVRSACASAGASNRESTGSCIAVVHVASR